MPPPLILTEGGAPRTAELSEHEAATLRTLKIADARPARHPGWYDVSPGTKVGAVSIGAREVIVRPKITDLRRLLFLVGYSVDRDLWRDDVVALDDDQELLPALAEAFSRLASRATEQGLLHGYRSVTDALPVLRGRLLAADQLRRFGSPVPLDVEYDDYTPDIPENRLLLAAVTRLLRVSGISVLARHRLQRLRLALADVTERPRSAVPESWTPSRLNARYHDALRLAEIVLRADSFEQHVGQLRVTGFLFDMWRVFEDFVVAALGDSLGRRGGRAAPKWSDHLDEANTVRIEPDLVWLDSHRHPRAVIDAKYKAERPGGFPDADLYQVLAYCTALPLREGHLVYAKGNEQSRHHVVRNAGVRIRCHTLDLSASPERLLAQVDKLASTIADM